MTLPCEFSLLGTKAIPNSNHAELNFCTQTNPTLVIFWFPSLPHTSASILFYFFPKKKGRKLKVQHEHLKLELILCFLAHALKLKTEVRRMSWLKPVPTTLVQIIVFIILWNSTNRVDNIMQPTNVSHKYIWMVELFSLLPDQHIDNPTTYCQIKLFELGQEQSS